LAAALGQTPSLPTTLMAKVEQIMQPSQRELFFTPLVVLVEGTEDIAFISTHLQLTGRWTRFRELGCHFVVAGGKSPMSRPLAIAAELGIPTFVVFDSDANLTKADERKKNAKDNSCILRLCGLSTFDPLPTDNLCGDNVVMWKSNTTNVVREEFADGTWDACEREARDNRGFHDVRLKSSLLIAATLEVLYERGKTSNLLERVAVSLISYAENVPQQEVGLA
jgi:predicted ATP-dependent endonuclease of OLD family